MNRASNQPHSKYIMKLKQQSYHRRLYTYAEISHLRLLLYYKDHIIRTCNKVNRNVTKSHFVRLRFDWDELYFN